MTQTGVLTDPAALSPSQWSARLAAFLSRGRGNGDPDVIACHEALSYWRVRRSIDAEREHLAEAHVPGAVATAMFHHGPRPSPLQMAEHLHGPDRDEPRAAAFSSMQPVSAPLLAVRPLVRRSWNPIAELATHIYFGRTIGHADVCVALGITDGGGPGSVELNSIRNDGTPRKPVTARAVG